MRAKVTDALGNSFEARGRSIGDIIAKVERTGRRNLFAVDTGSTTKFYLDRGSGPLWPISASAASVELGMGGFGR